LGFSCSTCTEVLRVHRVCYSQPKLWLLHKQPSVLGKNFLHTMSAHDLCILGHITTRWQEGRRSWMRRMTARS
jgi:hypothetical protein